MKCKDVMVDLETLGTTADAVIMSIGAVKFNVETDEIDDEGFYASISIDSNLDKGRRIDEETLIWWMGQSAQAQAVFREPKQDLAAALDDLAAWFGNDDKLTVWSNGADFDIPMLAHAYRQHDWLTPWKFWNARCFRTWKGLPAARKVNYEKVGVAHNALSDAINQAKHAQAIYAAMMGTTKEKA